MKETRRLSVRVSGECSHWRGRSRNDRRGNDRSGVDLSLHEAGDLLLSGRRVGDDAVALHVGEELEGDLLETE